VRPLPSRRPTPYVALVFLPRMRPRRFPGGSARAVLALSTALVLAAGSAACGRAAANPNEPAKPSPVATRWPAATEGGACQLLDYDVVEQATGTAFDVAAAADRDAAFTCVLQQRGATLPDLTLTVVSTKVTAAVYRSAVVPAKSAAVPGLGLAGYRLVTPPQDGAGTAVEVGWLAGNGRMLMLRYRLSQAGAAEVTALTDAVTALAKKIDTGSV
jgi:hypothetical protein